METNDNVSQHQWLKLETKFSVDQAQMLAQACVRLARAHNIRVTHKANNVCWNKRDPKYFESFEQAEGVFCVNIHEGFTP